jgi:hypothetical protein
MPTGLLIGLLHLVDEAAEGVDNADNAAQRSVHAVNAEILLTHALAQNKVDAHFVKDKCIINNINDSND